MSTALLPFGLPICLAILVMTRPLPTTNQQPSPTPTTAPAVIDTPAQTRTARSLGELPKPKTMKEVKLPTFVDSDSSRRF